MLSSDLVTTLNDETLALSVVRTRATEHGPPSSANRNGSLRWQDRTTSYRFIVLSSVACGVTLWPLVFSHAVPVKHSGAPEKHLASIPKEAEQEKDWIAAFLRAPTNGCKPAM
jgi:hypothetical protein